MSCKENLNELLAELRALAFNYQHAHWQTSGPNYYADHLLFERLYKSVSDEIDTLAEKMVGYYGPGVMSPMNQMGRMQAAVIAQNSEESMALNMLSAEKKFQQMIKVVYDQMKKEDELRLGMDDFLQAMASTHDTSIYLLQQRTMNNLNKLASKSRVEKETEDVDDQAKELGKALNKKKKGLTITNREIDEEREDVDDQQRELAEALAKKKKEKQREKEKQASLIRNGLSRSPWLRR